MQKKNQFSTKILGLTIVFNIDNNKKCFLSTKSAELFLKDHVTLKTEEIILKIQICHHLKNK